MVFEKSTVSDAAQAEPDVEPDDAKVNEAMANLSARPGMFQRLPWPSGHLVTSADLDALMPLTLLTPGGPVQGLPEGFGQIPGGQSPEGHRSRPEGEFETRVRDSSGASSGASSISQGWQ